MTAKSKFYNESNSSFFDIRNVQITFGQPWAGDYIALILWLATGISVLIVNLKYVKEPEHAATVDEGDVESPK